MFVLMILGFFAFIFLIAVLLPVRTEEVFEFIGKLLGPDAEKFLDQMARQKINNIERSRLDGACLLCSEDKPHHCHRRLMVEYLKNKWGDVEIEHL